MSGEQSSSTPPSRPGSITWQDLTVPDAERIREFYARVAGWLSTEQPISNRADGYSDYNMHDADGNIVAGICHARGSNAGIPPHWLIYITVDSADAAAQRAIEAGGQIVDGPRSMGGGRFVVIRDPAGAVAAFYST
ncbi:MAG: VOC family protein [Phycisphaerales bacterium]|nr:VOC family protein [Phycisphaerales bacterium]